MMQAINLEDYRIPDDATDVQVEDYLKRGPLWRICNIYRIKNADGVVIPFVPNWAQRVVLHKIYIEGRRRLAIPKARQLGISTLAGIIALDSSLFGENVQASIVDKTQPDASLKLKAIHFTYDELPIELKDAAVEDNTKAFGWANGSVIYAGKGARGGTNQYLWISEWGVIAFDDPARSAEINTGAIPSVSGDDGIILAEATHKGGKGGDWYDLVKRSLEVAPAYRTAKDFDVLFFAWYLEPRYTLAGDIRQIPAELLKYFHEKEVAITLARAKEGMGLERFRFTDGQKLWYFKERQRLGRAIYSEFPTVIEECWMAPFPGAIYAADVDKARAEGRINANVMHYEGFPVYSVFDIGAPVNTKCWLFQAIGDRLNWLETLTGGDDCNTPAEWVKRLKDKPYNYGGHFLPHDGETLWRRLMVEAGLSAVVVLPKPENEWDNINDSIQAFNRCHFNSVACEHGLDSLEAYRAKEESDGVTIRNVPVHDWASHASKAFGYAHQAIRLGLLVDRSAMPKRPDLGKPVAKTGLVSVHAIREKAKTNVTVITGRR